MVIQVSKHGQPKWVKYKMRVEFVWPTTRHLLRKCLGRRERYRNWGASLLFRQKWLAGTWRLAAGRGFHHVSSGTIHPCLAHYPIRFYHVLSCFHSKLTGYTFKSGFNVRTMLSILKMQTKYRMMMQTVKCFQFCSGFGRRDGWFTQAT